MQLKNLIYISEQIKLNFIMLKVVYIYNLDEMLELRKLI